MEDVSEAEFYQWERQSQEKSADSLPLSPLAYERPTTDGDLRLPPPDQLLAL